MLNFVFGRTFWSTVVRSALFVPLMSALALPLSVMFGAEEEMDKLRSVGVMMWVVTLLWGSLLGSWVGWGLAYWRFKERPVASGMFVKYPLFSGLVHGPVFWMFVQELSKQQPEIIDDQLAVTIFGIMSGR